MLFGWVGSNPRLLRKYAELYLALGISTVYTTTLPTWDLFMSHTAVRACAAETLAMLQRNHPNEPTLIFYSSNGGAFVHVQLLSVLAADARVAAEKASYSNVKIAATMFDSAPAFLSLRAGSMAVSEGFKNPIVRRLAFAVAYTFMALVYAPFISGFGVMSRYFQALEADHLKCPSLYIYSVTDRITDPVKLAQHIEERKKRHPISPNYVRALRIEAPSPHVSHLLRHPAEYAKAAETLLREVGMGYAAGASARL